MSISMMKVTRLKRLRHHCLKTVQCPFCKLCCPCSPIVKPLMKQNDNCCWPSSHGEKMRRNRVGSPAPLLLGIQHLLFSQMASDAPHIHNKCKSLYCIPFQDSCWGVHYQQQRNQRVWPTKSSCSRVLHAPTQGCQLPKHYFPTSSEG